MAAAALREAVSAPAQCAATFVGAYGSYVLAETFGWSGIFAVLAFGIALREFERHRISVASAHGVERFWEWAELLANIALFFLVGAALDLTRLSHTVTATAVTLGAVLVARFAVAYGLLAFARAQLRPFWMTVVRMAGVRGALSLALALATPASIVQRGSIIDATFAVVVATILFATLTLGKRLQRLPL